SSPFIFCLLTAVMAAGFARGFAFAVRTALAVAFCVAVPHYVLTHNSATFNKLDTAQWTVELLLVALVAGYASRLFGEVEARRTLAVDRMSRLAEANALLFSLHRVAQTLPASPDLDDVLASSASSPWSTRRRTTSGDVSSASSTVSSSPRRSRSTTHGGSAACAQWAQRRSGRASRATSTTGSARRSPTWRSSSTASRSDRAP